MFMHIFLHKNHSLYSQAFAMQKYITIEISILLSFTYSIQN